MGEKGFYDGDRKNREQCSENFSSYENLYLLFH